MNIALVVAGGSGKRTGQDVPKQFLNIYDVPIFIYTLNNLETLEQIDSIIVVGPEGWENYILSYGRQCCIRKLKAVVTGGDTRHHSILNGIRHLKRELAADDAKVCIIDANRPLIPHRVFVDEIDALEECDCALALTPCHDTMIRKETSQNICIEDRSALFCGQTPEAAHLKSLVEVYERAEHDGLDLVTTALFLHYGKSIATVEGSKRSMTITTVEDFEMFRAMLGDRRIQCIKEKEDN